MEQGSVDLREPWYREDELGEGAAAPGSTVRISRLQLSGGPADDVPFWDQPAYPDGLQSWFDTTALNHFMIVDGSRRKALKGVMDLANLDDELLVSALLHGEESVREAGPWLIDITRMDGPARSFLQEFFETHWGKRAGIFLRTKAAFQDVRQHLRRFTKVRSECHQDTLVFFRFWDPRVALYYVKGNMRRSDKIAPLLTLRGGECLDMLPEINPEKALTVSLRSTATTPRNKPFVLDSYDHSIFDEIAFRSLEDEIAVWLVGALPDRFGGLTAGAQSALGRHVVTEGRRFGFRLKEEFAYLAHMMTTLGGWFHEAGAPPAIMQILRDTGADKRHLQLAEVFGAAYEASPMAALWAEYPRLYEAVAGMGADAVTPEHFRNIFSQFAPHGRTAVQEIIDTARPHLETMQTPRLEEGKHLLLCIMLGYGFDTDPFRPWYDQSIDDSRTNAWVEVFPGLPGNQPVAGKTP